MDGTTCGALPGLPSLVEDRVCPFPDLLGDDRFHLGEDPVLLGLEHPMLLVAGAPRVVGASESLGGRVADEPVDRRIAPLRAVPGPVSRLVQEARDSFLPPMLEEEVEEELPNRGFFWIGNELAAFPAVAEGSSSPEGFTELRPDGNGSCHALRDLFALPLRHGRDHRVEQASRRARGVDRLLERDEVGSLGSEDVRELEKFLGVAGKSRELREDKAGDPAASHVSEHPVGFRQPHDRFPAHGFEVVDLADVPALRLGVGAGSSFVVLGAFAPDLILGRDPNPDPDRLRRLRLSSKRVFHGPPSTALKITPERSGAMNPCHAHHCPTAFRNLPAERESRAIPLPNACRPSIG